MVIKKRYTDGPILDAYIEPLEKFLKEDNPVPSITLDKFKQLVFDCLNKDSNIRLKSALPSIYKKFKGNGVETNNEQPMIQSKCKKCGKEIEHIGVCHDCFGLKR